MSAKGTEIIGRKLSSAIPREFLLSLERLVPRALSDANALGARFVDGHRPTASGLIRHLLLNEAMELALDEVGIPHRPLRGNAAMFGTVGVVTIARVHMGKAQWDNARRSKTKVRLCQPNVVAKRIAAPDLFVVDDLVTEQIEMTAFIVTEGDGAGGHAPIYVVVPDETMDLRNPVFRMALNEFFQLYQKAQDVEDNVKPKLKSDVKKLQDKANDQSDDSPDPKPTP